jgi:hypothetical protein
MTTKKHVANLAIYGASLILALTVPTDTIRAQDEKVGDASSSQTRPLDQRWIDSELALIETNLNFVLERNKRSPGSYSDVFAEELRLRAKLFETWRAQLGSDQPNFIAIDIQKAEGDLMLAKMSLAAAEKVRARVPSSVSNIEIKKRKLAVEAAQRWLEKVSDPSYKQLSKHERTQWRLIILGKDILEMRIDAKR